MQKKSNFDLVHAKKHSFFLNLAFFPYPNKSKNLIFKKTRILSSVPNSGHSFEELCLSVITTKQNYSVLIIFNEI